jgi:hypothetical protein
MSKSSNEPGPGSADPLRATTSPRPDVADLKLRKKPPQSSRGKVHVITIRNVPPDRRPWTAGIPASICALIALGVLSSVQHSPRKFSVASVPAVTSAHPETRASEAGTGLKTINPVGPTDQTSTLELARSVRTKTRTRGSRALANDTFVDYRHQPSGQSETDPEQPVIKRVVVYN